MRRILFFVITLFLFSSTIAQSEQEKNISEVKNTTTTLLETNISKKQQKKKITKKTINNNFVKPKAKKIFLVSELNKNKINNDTFDYISLKENIKFPISFKSVYIAKSGDTLGHIAKKFGVGQGEIKILNPEIDFNSLPIGKEIIMPISQNKINEIEKQITASNKNSSKIDQKIIFAPAGRQMRVIASAYTSHASQTDGSPFIGAWGHKFAPGMKILAVSNDLIRDHGITNGTKIKIGGLDGHYIVRDKMNKRYTKHIDIYMGLDRTKALKWGRRSVVIYW